MKTLLSRWSWIRLIEGILLIILGLLIGILGGIDPSGMTKALSIVIAVFLFIDGGITLFGYVINPSKNFSLECIVSALLISFGVVLCTDVGQISLSSIISTFAISVLLSSALAFLVKAIFGIYYHSDKKWVTLNFIIFALATILGILAIVYRDNYVNQIIYITIGTGVVVVGVFDIILAVQAIKEGKSVSGYEVKRKVINVDITNKNDESVNGYIGKTKEVKKLTNKKANKNEGH